MAMSMEPPSHFISRRVLPVRLCTAAAAEGEDGRRRADEGGAMPLSTGRAGFGLSGGSWMALEGTVAIFGNAVMTW